MRARTVVISRLTALTLAALALAAVALAGCGPLPPQAPLAQAKRLNGSLSAISTACGLADQTSAFAGPGQGALAPLERSARAAARKLSAVEALDPAWIYQGQTTRRIVAEAADMLRGCGLTHAAAVLAGRT